MFSISPIKMQIENQNQKVEIGSISSSSRPCSIYIKVHYTRDGFNFLRDHCIFSNVWENYCLSKSLNWFNQFIKETLLYSCYTQITSVLPLKLINNKITRFRGKEKKKQKEHSADVYQFHQLFLFFSLIENYF